MRAPAQAAPVRQGATTVVISEFRTRGSNGGNDEFVEIYNPTLNPVNISGWLIRASNNAGNIGNRFTFPAGTVIQSGQYYIVTGTTYSGGVQENPVASLSGTGITDDGGIALTLSDGTTIIDQVGMSAGSAYGEGTRLTPLNTNNNRSYERRLGGLSDSCQDISDNVADFQEINPSNPQNSAAAPRLCGVPLPTSTPTGTATQTATSTATGTATNTSPPPATGIVISEFRTTGPNGGNDEFVELYNPTGSPVSIGGWIINRSSGCGTTVNLAATIPSGVTLASGQHYLIGGASYSGSITPDLSDTLGIADTGGIALFNGVTIVDQVGLCTTTLYLEGSPLTSLTTSTNRSYDRKSSPLGNCIDSNNNAADFIVRSPSDPQNTSSPLTNCGNPTLTPTITRTPTRTRTPSRTPTITRTPTRTPIPPLLVINEFVPRPGHDWNGDGVINVGDEYIEILNHGVVDVDLAGHTLDDEVNIGSAPYRLPSVVLKPGERIAFFESETGLLLSDGGDGVRLLRPNGQLFDAYNYTVVRFPDHAYCRYPDNGGADDWNTNCFPTPGRQNSLSGVFVPTPDGGVVEVACPLSDTQPSDFIWAECQPFGQNIFRPAFWDRTGWFGEKYLPESPGKWPVFAD
ncbi:MAG TPA: lamin tail domain-containing protein [Anaerolineales bacterium]|nr:lamin tail domain-containing protein [Anaerolineales bacterium]